MTPQERFIEWFLENYPEGCILSKPAWHAPKIWRAAVREAQSRDIALTEAAHDLLNACDMEQHNEDIFKGNFKKGSKAWSGEFVRKMRLDAMERIRAITAVKINDAPQGSAPEPVATAEANVGQTTESPAVASPKSEPPANPYAHEYAKDCETLARYIVPTAPKFVRDIADGWIGDKTREDE